MTLNEKIAKEEQKAKELALEKLKDGQMDLQNISPLELTLEVPENLKYSNVNFNHLVINGIPFLSKPLLEFFLNYLEDKYDRDFDGWKQEEYYGHMSALDDIRAFCGLRRKDDE
jgi:hypothetical protein